MNKVFMCGRLTRDPEVRQSNTSTVAGFSIAVDRKFKRDGEPDADFFNCSAFGKTAEFVERYMKKGTKVIVEGRIQNDSYTNKDGQKVNATRIIVDSLEFAESKNASGNQTESKPSEAKADADGYMTIPEGLESELPFA